MNDSSDRHCKPRFMNSDACRPSLDDELPRAHFPSSSGIANRPRAAVFVSSVGVLQTQVLSSVFVCQKTLVVLD